MALRWMMTGQVSERLRAVFDTNVYVSALLSRNATSPTKELLRRWEDDAFGLMVCDALTAELAEKLDERGAPPPATAELLAQLIRMAEWIDVPLASIEPLVANDPDDDVILACALIGRADYLVTYDPHLKQLGELFRGIKIVEALPFLWHVRGDTPPGTLS